MDRLRPYHPHHAWSYDFVNINTHDGRAVRMLDPMDGYACKCFAI